MQPKNTNSTSIKVRETALKTSTSIPDARRCDDATDECLRQWRRDPTCHTSFSVAASVCRDHWRVFCTSSLADSGVSFSSDSLVRNVCDEHCKFHKVVQRDYSGEVENVATAQLLVHRLISWCLVGNTSLSTSPNNSLSNWTSRK